MQVKVVFKLDVFEEKIKQNAMKVVCEFPGVTLIDVKETGSLKYKRLKKIYKYVDIMELGPDGEPEQNPNPVKKPEPIVKKTPSSRRWKIGFF
ncbi:hypothetical protein EUTSA_v10015896mg [Eutrema salsugineum]|uniref:HMA domain-containing protein n=1 Tax=Eutrema salsugineum TaxID=72664 RepID=V4NBF7_EUTSA|nr:hypothetical protein EUTSA_v10015896mg [Eutrema salsugineum]